jgi:4-diphosphocytidyl-2-C-methyl-D-erythritol kinase
MGQAALNPSLGFSGDPMAATCALGEGAGEQLTPLPPLSGWVLLAKPPLPVSTAKVYDGLVLPIREKRPDTAELSEGLRSKNYDKILKNMVNVLEIITVKEYPTIIYTKNLLTKCAGAETVLMSGSGPTFFAWYRNHTACEIAYAAIAESAGLKKNTLFMARLL